MVLAYGGVNNEKKNIENMQHWDNFFSFVSGGKGFYTSFSYTL